MNNILKEIEKCDLNQLHELLLKIESQQKLIIEMHWEEHYKELCNEKYLSLSDVFTSLSLENLNKGEYEKLQLLKDFCYKRCKKTSISEIIEKICKLDLLISKEFSQMICKACVCKGCKYINECWHNFTCDECSENGYNNYNWTCEE